MELKRLETKFNTRFLKGLFLPPFKKMKKTFGLILKGLQMPCKTLYIVISKNSDKLIF